MARNFLPALRYLAPRVDSFWRWNDGGEVLDWRSGGTIAFRSEVVDVLRRLAPRGFPHFDAVVLLLAACRSPHKIDERVLEQNGVLPALSESDKKNWRYRDLLVALEALSAISSEVRGTLSGKIDLAAMLFETAYVAVPSESASVIVRELEQGLPREMFASRWVLKEPDALDRLAALAAGAHRVAPDRVALWRQTGLEQLPESETVEDLPPEPLRALLERLKTDEELGSLARLARRLLAALTLPREVSEPQELPLGGVSDITNRGPFDRLLVSELAHDDLTFTVRVALNEALYLRREAPPHTPPKGRVIMIDCGLRMWGLPRVFGTAAALALAVSRDRQPEATVYRARGEHLDVVDLARRQGLVSHLASLEPDAHPGAALPVFRRLALEDETENETVLITSFDTLEDRTFRRLLDQSEFPCLYIVAVSREGDLRLARRGRQGTKILRELKCSLDEIVPARPHAVPLRDSSVDPSLPAILRIEPFPLRLPHPIDPARLWGQAPDGILSLTADRRLVHWDRRGLGPRQISDRVPSGQLLWRDAGPGPRQATKAVVGRLQQSELYLLDVDLDSFRCESRPIALRQSQPRSVAAHAGALFVIFANHVEVCSLDDGTPIETRPIPDNMWCVRDRFFYSIDGWQALSFDGTTARFDRVCDLALGHRHGLVGLFDQSSVDGPVAVDRQGHRHQVHDLHGSGPRAGPPLVGSPVRIAGVSGDGRFVVLSGELEPGGRARPLWLLDADGSVNRTSGDPATLLVGHLLSQVANRTLRHKFTSISIDGHALVLAARGCFCRIEWDEGHHRIRMHAVKSKTGFGQELFEPASAPAGTGYRLSRATWRDGSRAYLDSRGLLHLASSNRSIPELTLVLYEGTMSGWCAQGGTFGVPYFTFAAEETGARRVYSDVFVPFVTGLR